MRCAIVTLGAVQAAGRMDADFFADPEAGYGPDIARTERRLAESVARLTKLRTAQAADIAKREALGIRIVEV